MRLLLGFIIQTHQTPALKQKSCRACSGLALLPGKGTAMPLSLCSGTEGEHPAYSDLKTQNSEGGRGVQYKKDSEP